MERSTGIFLGVDLELGSVTGSWISANDDGEVEAIKAAFLRFCIENVYQALAKLQGGIEKAEDTGVIFGAPPAVVQGAAPAPHSRGRLAAVGRDDRRRCCSTNIASGFR